MTSGDAVLISAGTVATMDAGLGSIDHGGVLVRGGEIAAVGSAAVLADAHPDVGRVDLGDDAVLTPGLVNTHTHLFQTLLKGLGDDRPLNRWLVEMTGPAGAALLEEDCEAAAAHGAVEAVRSGCTTLVDFMYAHPRPSLTDAVIRGIDSVGVRAVVARGFVTRGVDQGLPPALIESTQRALDDCERLLAEHRDHPRIRIGVAPCLLWMVDEAALRATREFATEHGLLITYHMAETTFETSYAMATYGKGEVEFLADVGFLGPNLLAVHCTKLQGAEIETLAAHEVKVSHNPVSNMYLAAGIAPIPAMLAAGITVGLATDGPASNNNQNMLEVLKAAALLHKVATEDPAVLDASRVLRMATIDGARAIGMDDEIGSITPGKRADLAGFSLANPFVTPVHDPVSSLVYAASGGEATFVMVDGRVLLRDGRLTSADEAAVMARSATAARDLARRAGIGPR